MERSTGRVQGKSYRFLRLTITCLLHFFQKYHSMSARGERVEDVLDAVEKEEEAQCVIIRYTLSDQKTKANRSTINTKTENVDTTTGLPPWETVQEPVVEETRENIQTIKEESKVEPVDVHPSQTSNQAPSGISQALLDSGSSTYTLV